MKDLCKGTSNAAMAAAARLLKEDELELNSLADNLNDAVEVIKKITTRGVKCDD